MEERTNEAYFAFFGFGSGPKRTKSQLVEGWKEMCSEWCSYF